MSETKELINGKFRYNVKKKSLFNKFSCKFLTAFLFFIPPYFKKKKKILKYDGLRWRDMSNDYENNGKDVGTPYIVCVENVSTKAVHNVELFGSNDMLTRDVFDKDGNYVNLNLNISSNIPEVSYKDILRGMSMSKFKVGLTYIMTTNQKQIFHPLRVVKKMIYGDLWENVLIVTKDPYQQQMNIVAVKQCYEIDGLTTLVIPTVEPKTKVTYYFYPDPLAYIEVKKENFAFRLFTSISNLFKKKEFIKGIINKPYTIQVTNNTDEVKKNVSLFGSYPNISPRENKIFNQNNDLVEDGVTIKSLTPNISYAEMLYYIMNNPLRVGLNYIRSSEGDKNQILEDFYVRTKDISGNIYNEKITTHIDPYQSQIDVISNNKKFSIDGLTELIIIELQPKTTVVYQFYPEDEVVNK